VIELSSKNKFIVKIKNFESEDWFPFYYLVQSKNCIVLRVINFKKFALNLIFFC